MKKFLLLMLSAVFSAAASAQGELLLVVDLSVADTVTINATSGNSAATRSGSDTIGVYLEDFYAISGSAVAIPPGSSGNLTNAENPTDNSPSLFRGGAGSDLGLNIWSFSSDTTVNFTAGALAFTGTATWTVTTAVYDDMVAGPVTGDLYFPADTFDDLAGGATFIGTWEKVLPTPTYSVGGAVTGLVGSVTLQNNGGDDLVVATDGSFTFTTELLNTEIYAVTVLTQPTDQTCTVTDGSGTVTTADITDITVSCADTAAAPAPQAAPEPPKPVPTMSLWGLGFLSAMICIIGMYHRRWK